MLKKILPERCLRRSTLAKSVVKTHRRNSTKPEEDALASAMFPLFLRAQREKIIIIRSTRDVHRNILYCADAAGGFSSSSDSGCEILIIRKLGGFAASRRVASD